MKSLLTKLLASSCSAVLHPHRLPSWKSQNSHGGWSPRLELTWPVWLPSKKDFYENIILFFFLIRDLKNYNPCNNVSFPSLSFFHSPKVFLPHQGYMLPSPGLIVSERNLWSKEVWGLDHKSVKIFAAMIRRYWNPEKELPFYPKINSHFASVGISYILPFGCCVVTKSRLTLCDPRDCIAH